MESNALRQLIIEILKHWQFQLETNQCTEPTLRSIFCMVAENVVDESDVKNIADFYHQKENNVRSVISKNLIAKPKRKVIYNFLEFLKIKPKNWLH
jgi:hypothetical protein